MPITVVHQIAWPHAKFKPTPVSREGERIELTVLRYPLPLHRLTQSSVLICGLSRFNSRIPFNFGIPQAGENDAMRTGAHGWNRLLRQESC